MYSLCFHRTNYVWRPQNSAPSPKILSNVYFCAQVAKYRRMPSFLCKAISGTGILKISLSSFFFWHLMSVQLMLIASSWCWQGHWLGRMIVDVLYIYRRFALNWFKAVSINCRFQLKNSTVWHRWNADQTQQSVNLFK